MSSDTQRLFTGKHLVVFGAGYIGGEIARQAMARGMKVTVLTRNPAKASEFREQGMTVSEADLADHGWHGLISTEVDFVLNSVSSGGGGVEGYRHSYVEGMRSILKWAENVNVGTFIYTGSTSVYSQGAGVSVDEGSPTEPENERAALLIETEDMIRRSSEFARWFILRLAGIYGPGRHYLLEQLRRGEPLAGDGSHRLNLAHRDDICAAIWLTLGAPGSVASQVFNVSDGAPVSKAELMIWLAQKLNAPAPRFDPTLHSVRSRVVPDRIIVNSKLKRVLGWTPVFTDYRAGFAAILKTL